MSAALEALAQRVRTASGLVFEGARLESLHSAVRRLGFEEPDELLRRLDDPALAADLTRRLVDEVAVKETFFFRHDDELRALDWPGLLAAARARGAARLRIWCSACATGEEAWSLAILALEALGPQAPVDVLGTDISTAAIRRARAADYRARAVASVPPEVRARWFEPGAHGGLCVGGALRQRVRFATHNLVGDAVPPLGEGPFDVVTCRNLLIYFSPEQAQRTIAALGGALVPGGRLVLGAADRLTSGTLRRLDGLEPARPRPPRARRRAPRPAGERPPDSGDCLERGRRARARGDHAEAVRWLRRALYLDPGCGVAGLELALAYGAQGDVGAVRRALWTAIQATQPPRSDDDVALLAECRLRLERLDDGQDDGGGS
ncbi:MAG: CheR family methyltransferase [Solirubrobacterales bacterium]